MDPTGINVTLAAGESLLSALSRQGIALAHDCGGKLSCATCMVIVHQGGERLDRAGDDEIDILERADAPAGARLACQARGEGVIGIEVPQHKAAQPRAPEAPLPIRLGEGAARHLRRQLRQANANAVRLRVVPAGCSGFGYKVETVGAIAVDDTSFESEGVRIVVDVDSLPRLHGTTLELVHEGLARRIRFDNPNARQTCGCGESFRA